MVVGGGLVTLMFFFFQAEDGIRDSSVTGVRRVLFRSGESIAQVVSESLNAESKKARNRSMLDLQSGNYDLTKVQDSRTITTLIETAGKQVTGALRKTQERQMQTWDQLVEHRTQQHRETPGGRSFTEQLALR